jgi:hypothetical protein
MPRHKRENRYRRETPEEARLRRDYAIEASFRNLAKARSSPRYHPPRRWRSAEESLAIKRRVFQLVTSRDRNKPSGRAWARELGISHTWLQKLIREFQADPSEMWRLQARYGDPTLAQLDRAREYTRRMRERGELRPRCRKRVRASEQV